MLVAGDTRASRFRQDRRIIPSTRQPQGIDGWAGGVSPIRAYPAKQGRDIYLVIGAALSYSERIQLFLTAPKAHPLQTVFQVTPDDPDSAWTLPWTQWPPSSLDGKSLVGLTAANLQEIKSHKGGDPVGRMQLWLTDGQNIYSTWKEAEGINQPWRPIIGPVGELQRPVAEFPQRAIVRRRSLPGSHLLKLSADDSAGSRSQSSRQHPLRQHCQAAGESGRALAFPPTQTAMRCRSRTSLRYRCSTTGASSWWQPRRLTRTSSGLGIRTDSMQTEPAAGGMPGRR